MHTINFLSITATVLVSFISAFASVCQVQPSEDYQNTISSYNEQVVSFEQLGIAPTNYEGAIVAEVGDKVIFAGGSDEQGKPTSQIYWAYKNDLSDWREQSIDHPVAFAASVIVGEKVICIGGLTDSGLSKDVYILSFAGEQLVIKKADWQLPAPLGYSAAGVWKDKIYIVGGLTASNPERHNQNLYIYDHNSGAFEANEVQSLASKQPAVAAQNDGLYVISDKRVHRIAYEHIAGVKVAKLLDAPVDLGVVSLAPIGQSHILVVSEKFTDSPLMYHTITDTFTKLKDAPEVDFAVASIDDDVLVIGAGEIYKTTLNPITGLMRAADYIIVAAYLAVLVGIGVYFSKREKSTENFFVGGRKVPTWAVAFSLFATGTSGISFMAIPAKSYMTDLLFFGAVVISIGFSIAIAFVMPYFRNLEITSIYEYLEMRFDKFIRLAGAAVCLVYELGARMSVALYIPAVALTAVTGIDIKISIVVMGVLATVYTVLGGIEAVIWSDVVQSMVMIGGAIVAAVLLIRGTDGGVSGYIDMSAAYNKFKMFDFRWDYTLPVVWVMAANCFAVAVQNISNQSMLQRVFCTTDPKQARNSQLLSTLVCVIMAVIFWGIGTMLFTYFKSNPGSLIPSLPDDSIFPLFIVKNIPVGLCGLVIAGLFSAAMSTLDSSMNTVSAVVVTDFYSKIKPQANEQSKMILARYTTLFVGVCGTSLALLLASSGIKSVFDVWMILSSLLISTLPAVMLLGLFTKRTSTVGAYVAIAVSIVVAVSVKYTPMHFFLYSFCIIVVAAVCGYAVSFIFPEKREIAGLTISTAKD